MSILKLRRWQAFLIIVIMPMALVILVDPLTTNNVLLWMTALYWLQTLSIALFFGWLCLTGKALHKLFPADIKVPLWGLYVACALPVLFSATMSAGITTVLIEHPGSHLVLRKGVSAMGLEKVLLVGAGLGTLYALYYVARSVKTAAAGAKVSANAWIPTFLQLLFFPIGVWVLLPEINGIAAARENRMDMDIFKGNDDAAPR